MFDVLFATNAAPMLLIDPEQDGAIIDANAKAAEFYGHSRSHFRTLHVWDINTLERSVLPAMREIASWQGGHHPQRFRHRMADGTERDVQVYAGPVFVNARRLLLCIVHDVTGVLEAELFNRLILENVQVGVCGIDRDGNFTFVNPAAALVLGFRHDSEVIRANIGRFLIPERRPSELRYHPVMRVAETGVPVLALECVLHRCDGSPFPARVTASPIAGQGATAGVVVSFIDLTEEKEQDARIADLANSLPGAVFQAKMGRGGRLRPTYFSAAAGTLFGLPPGALPMTPAVLATVMTRRAWFRVWRDLLHAARTGTAWEHEFHVGDPQDGKWLLGRAQPRRRVDGSVVFNGVLLDITERKRLEIGLETAAMNDPLTGVWNRRRFEEALDEAAARSARYGRPYSLALIDIDHFKRVNDRHGHAVGDEALRRVARALAGRIRQADCFARWGGEEFVLLLPETDATAANAVAGDLLRTIETLSIPIAGRLTVSIGVGQGREGEESGALFRRVDAALYKAKAAGRNRVMLA